MRLRSFAAGEWFESSGKSSDQFHAVTGDKVAEVSSEGLNFKQMLEYARDVGNPRLRCLTFHERGRILKQLALYLEEHKKELYQTSAMTGATRADSWFDIDGGIGTFFVYASKGRRELPDESVLVDGVHEHISKQGTFLGQHICTPLKGVAVHINAYNFPVWGMMEKLAPTFLAGMPAIVKPASATAFLTEKAVSLMLESGILPEGSLQLICGGVGDLFDHLTCQDVVTFTGSAETGKKLKSHPALLENSVRFNMEADSLNCTILAEDVQPDDPEFTLFIKEVVREMTVKAGQKCTAIRRIIVPKKSLESVRAALKQRLSKVVVGDPSQKEVRMGPLASRAQLEDVKEKVASLSKVADLVFGGFDDFSVEGADAERGAFCPIVLLEAKDPFASKEVHEIEAFGPVSTILSYEGTEQAIELACKGQGSLVASIFSANDSVSSQLALGIAPFHGRILIVNRNSAAESTGHGSPLPHLVHGGPGRAGGGEEMGGVRGLTFYMQRTALQGSPETLSQICNEWLPGAEQRKDRIHPFRKHFEELEIGETLLTHRRTVSEADVVNFAGISGDYFYAHVDDLAARQSLFERRVAHGYFVISAAAGLFVWPGEGPVLANYGLEGLRFIKPVYIGDTIAVRLTCMRKTRKEKREGEDEQGVVEWDVEVFNQDDDTVATYSILTLVRCATDSASVH